jgi:hypothetical protein
MVRVFAAILVCGVLAWAAAPVASVTSAGPIQLSGSAAPATAVASLPLVVGDRITTSNFAALVMFTDRSRLMVAPNSSVKVEGGATGILVRISDGVAALYPSNGSAIRLVNAAAGLLSPASGLRSVALAVRATADDTRSRTCPPGHEDPDNHDCGLGNN